MAIVYVDRDSISLKTCSRNGCSPQHFIILNKELQRLEEEKCLITKDIHSYAELRLCSCKILERYRIDIEKTNQIYKNSRITEEFSGFG